MSSSCDIFSILSKNKSKDERKSCRVIELKMGSERYLLLEQQAWVEAEVYSLKKRKKNGQERTEDKRRGADGRVKAQDRIPNMGS